MVFILFLVYFLFVYLFMYLSFGLSIYFAIYLPACRVMYSFSYLFYYIFDSLHLSVYLYIRLPISNILKCNLQENICTQPENSRFFTFFFCLTRRSLPLKVIRFIFTLFIYLYISIKSSVCLFTSGIFLSIYLSIWLSCLLVFMPMWIFFRVLLSIFHLSVYLSPCLSLLPTPFPSPDR